MRRWDYRELQVYMFAHVLVYFVSMYYICILSSAKSGSRGMVTLKGWERGQNLMHPICTRSGAIFGGNRAINP